MIGESICVGAPRFAPRVICELNDDNYCILSVPAFLFFFYLTVAPACRMQQMKFEPFDRANQMCNKAYSRDQVRYERRMCNLATITRVLCPWEFQTVCDHDLATPTPVATTEAPESTPTQTPIETPTQTPAQTPIATPIEMPVTQTSAEAPDPAESRPVTWFMGRR